MEKSTCQFFFQASEFVSRFCTQVGKLWAQSAFPRPCLARFTSCCCVLLAQRHTAWGGILLIMEGGRRRDGDGLVFVLLGCISFNFLFAAFISQWPFLNSACFTMISVWSAEQLYDVVVLFDSYLARSHVHNSNKYFCSVYVYILDRIVYPQICTV